MSLTSGYKTWITKQKAAFYRFKHNNPAKKLRIIGITGSRGKTIVAHAIYQMLATSGVNVGMISSEGIFIVGRRPDLGFSINVANAEDLQKILRIMMKSRVQLLVLELPSHLAAEHAYDGMRFDSIVLTNIAGGSIANEYGSQLEYAEQVFKPVTQTIREGLAVINADDDSVEWIKQRASEINQNIYAAWVSKHHAQDFKQSLAGMSFTYEGAFYESPLYSSMMLENLLLAIRVCMKYLGTDLLDRAISTFEGVPGRLELVNLEPFSVVVDYEYLPMVLSRVYSNLKEIIGTGRLISVVGVAGDRKGRKSGLMHSIVNHSDIIILTAVDPRSESVININNEILKSYKEQRGVLVERIGDHKEYVMLDKMLLLQKINRVIESGGVPIITFDENNPSSRHDGVHLALNLAQAGDLVVTSAKGNDDVMDYGNTVFEWNDKTVILELLSSAMM